MLKMHLSSTDHRKSPLNYSTSEISCGPGELLITQYLSRGIEDSSGQKGSGKQYSGGAAGSVYKKIMHHKVMDQKFLMNTNRLFH